MITRHSNPRLQGAYGVVAAIAWFMENGYTIFVPLAGEAQRYDLVVEKEATLSRVEVKSTTADDDGSWSVELRTCGGNKSGSRRKLLDRNEFDLLFVVTPDGNYLLPSEYVHGKGHLHFGRSRKHDQYKLT